MNELLVYVVNNVGLIDRIEFVTTLMLYAGVSLNLKI